jgi:hypothetical protein
MVNFPGSWLLLFLFLLAGSAYFFYRAGRYFWDSSWADQPDQLCCLYKQRIDLGVVCLAQMLLFGQAAVLAWMPLPGLMNGRVVSALVAAVVLALSLAMMVITCVVYLGAQVRPPGGRSVLERCRQYARMTLGSQRIRGCPARLGVLSLSGFWIALFDVLTLVLLILVLAWIVWQIGRTGWNTLFSPPDANAILDFERLVHLSNGVTSNLPVILFCTALFTWGFCLVKKQFLANRCGVECPFPGGTPGLTGLRDIDGQVHSELMPPSTLRNHFWKCALLFVLVAVFFFWFQQRAIPPVDGWWIGFLSLVGFALGAVLLLFTLLQFYYAWHSLRKLLRLLALLPMQTAFQRLNDKVVATFGDYLFSLRPRHSHLSVSVQQFRRLEQLYPAFRHAVEQANANQASLGPLNPAAVAALWVELQGAFPNPNQFEPTIAVTFAQEFCPARETDLGSPPATPGPWGGLTGQGCSKLADRCLRVLRHFWPLLTLEEAFGQPTSGEQRPAAPGYLSLPAGDPVREWATAAEDFCAIEITRYLSQFVVQLRTLLMSLTLGALLLLVAAAVYPFFPQRALLLFLTTLGGVTALAIVAFLVQINRDELISRITRSAPNRFTPDLGFLQGAVTYVLPIAVAFMVQFPFVTSTLRSLLDPLFHIIR